VKICDSIMIEGVLLTPLCEIDAPPGSVLKFITDESEGFSGFAECYISEIAPNDVKAWKYHEETTQNICVPFGQVRLVVYDSDECSKTFGMFNEFVLGRPGNFMRLTIPPRLWYGFVCISSTHGLIVNLINVRHGTSDMKRNKINAPDIPYIWPEME
jgi:dTDP-4-dehydrorhamnose 3,5-epimerase